MSRTRRSPGSKSRATSTTPIADIEFSAHRPEDGYAAPTAQERAVQRALDVVMASGYGITVPCLVCGHPLTSARSMAAMVGPTCRRRLAEVAA